MKRQWLAFAGVVAASFAVLGWAGVRVYQQAPPVPDRVVTAGGQVVIGHGDIAAGQDVWRSLGGMEMGSIWGHGSYVAPDWTADYLHREAEIVLDEWSRGLHGRSYASLESGAQAALRDRLQRSFRGSAYDVSRGELVIDTARATAFARNTAYYADIFDPGKIWQIGLLVGLFLWLFLLARAILPALRRDDDQRPILTLFLISSIAIASFYGAALGAGRHTSLSMAEYWRWWVVHLWVEGFFEVFATVVIAFLFARLGLVGLKSAARASTQGATIYLAGGIIGTLHHLYFSGTPAVVMALGAVFSALEVVPLLFVGFEAWENLKRTTHAPWLEQYKWPIYFFVAVAFWNLVGAGLFGFMINPPIALYYMQGLNTTPVHGHAALFGVYGMLGLGLMLCTLRALNPVGVWRDGLIKFGFWSTNVGLMAMVGLSLLPVGLAQTWASVETGYWYARSPEFIQSPVLQVFRWLRAPGDMLFTAGILAVVIFVAGLAIGFSFEKEKVDARSLVPVGR